MLNRNSFVIACCFVPFCAHAEVLDKFPQTQDMWLHAALGVLFAGIALRIHWGVFALALVYPALWFASLLIDLHSFDLGPAIVAEGGRQYSIHSHVAAIVWLLGVVGLMVWKKICKLEKEKISQSAR